MQTLLRTLAHSTHPEIHTALATSSHRGNFEIKTAHLQDLFADFKEENIILGDDARISPGRGKPAPDIYLLALKMINKGIRYAGREKEVEPAECLVLEDSVPGVEAGRRAGMQVVWCPHPELLNEYHGREKEVLAGLAAMNEEHDAASTVRKAQDDIDGKEKRTGEEAKGAPGRIDDGWAVLLQTLENFPYAEYGINV